MIMFISFRRDRWIDWRNVSLVVHAQRWMYYHTPHHTPHTTPLTVVQKRTKTIVSTFRGLCRIIKVLLVSSKVEMTLIKSPTLFVLPPPTFWTAHIRYVDVSTKLLRTTWWRLLYQRCQLYLKAEIDILLHKQTTAIYDVSLHKQTTAIYDVLLHKQTTAIYDVLLHTQTTAIYDVLLHTQTTAMYP